MRSFCESRSWCDRRLRGGSRLELYPGVVIAELDATRHKVPAAAGEPVEGYPTLRLYPAERDGSTRNKQAPIAFTGRREVADMEQFVRRHAVTLQLLDELKAQVGASVAQCHAPHPKLHNTPG